MAEEQEVNLNSTSGEEGEATQTQAPQGFIQSLINAMKKDKMILVALILGVLSLGFCCVFSHIFW